MRAVPFTDDEKAALPDAAVVIVMGPPPGWDGSECGTTEVVRSAEEMHTGRPVTSHTTKWMPTKDDLDRLNAGAAIYLQTLGDGMPPVWCGTDPWGNAPTPPSSLVDLAREALPYLRALGHLEDPQMHHGGSRPLNEILADLTAATEGTGR